MRAFAALIALLLQGAPSQPVAKATIEGTVLRAGSTTPIAGTRVGLLRSVEAPPARTPGVSTIPQELPSTTTDTQGKFQLKEVDPGSYRLTFSAAGYVKQEYGQKLFPGQGTPLEVARGQSLKDLTVRMEPTGAVSGRIRNANNQPAPALPVHLLRFSYDATGRRTLQPVASTQTDDRGEYRIFYLTPGRYYLAAGMLREASPTRAFNGVMESYPLTYYPAGTDIGQATAVEVKSGSDVSADLTTIPQPLRRIRGRIVDPRVPQQPPTSVIIGLTSRGTSYVTSYEVNQQSITYNNADGSFEVRNVLPGLYLLNATWGDSITVPQSLVPGGGAPPAPPTSPPQPNSPQAVQQRQQTTDLIAMVKEGVAYATVTVGNADLDNVQLTILPGGSLPGRIRADGSTDSLQTLKVQLKPSLDGRPATIPGVYVPANVPVAADNTFRVANVKPGEYRVALDGLPAGYYLKEARLGADDVLNSPLQFSASNSSNVELDIVLGSGAVTLDGTANNERQEPVSGAVVVLVPERQKDRTDLYKTATTDARGHFTMSAIAPGDYKLFAWEALEPNAYFDAELLKHADALGKSIHLQERTPKTETIRVVPATF